MLYLHLNASHAPFAVNQPYSSHHNTIQQLTPGAMVLRYNIAGYEIKFNSLLASVYNRKQYATKVVNDHEDFIDLMQQKLLLTLYV